MMQRAFQNGVTRFFIPAIDSTYTEAMYDLEKIINNVFLMMGYTLPM
jgi:TatD DNase family protein